MHDQDIKRSLESFRERTLENRAKTIKPPAKISLFESREGAGMELVAIHDETAAAA